MRFLKTHPSFGINAYFFFFNLYMFSHSTPIVPDRKPKSSVNFSSCHSGMNEMKMIKKRAFGMIIVCIVVFLQQMM